MFSNLAKILQDPEKVNSLELLGSKDCSFVYFTQVLPMESKKKKKKKRVNFIFHTYQKDRFHSSY